VAQIEEIPLFARHANEVRREFPGIPDRRMIHETTRRMINTLIVDLIAETRRRLTAAAPKSIDAVRSGAALVAFSPSMRTEADELKRFLGEQLYRHFQVMRMTEKAKRIVRELFATFRGEPRLLPMDHRQRVEAEGPRAIADYVAGMTDRYAIREHRRLFTVGDG
jgi:dGTPase